MKHSPVNKTEISHTIEMLKQQIHLLYKALPASAIATIIASLLTLAILKNKVNFHVLYTWTFLHFLVSSARLILFLYYKRNNALITNYIFWEKCFLAGSTISAIVWGSAGIFLFIPHNPEYQAILSLILSGIASGAVTSLSFRIKPVLLFIYTATIPLIITLFIENSEKSVILSFMNLLVLAFTTRTAIQFYQTSRDNILSTIDSNKKKEEVFKSQQKLALHIEKTPLAFIEWDIDFKVVEWNHAAETIFGYTKNEAMGHHAAGLIVPEQIRDVINTVWSNLVARKGGERSTNENLTKSGDTIFCEWYNTPLVDKNDTVFGVASIVKDITNEKRNREELVKAREDAEKANHSKSEFLSRMSHELRTPLNAILGFGQLLFMDSACEKEEKEQLEHILSSGQHLLDLINEILDIARIDSGEIKLNINDINISRLIENISNMINTIAAKQEIKIINTIPSNIIIKSDTIRLKQILLNLVSNAVKYNKKGGVIELTAKKENNLLTIYIKDTGTGIPKENQSRIFEPFYRIEETSNVEGTGIGLTVTKKLVELLGGKIGFESQQGEGSLFWIEFPFVLTSSSNENAPRGI